MRIWSIICSGLRIGDLLQMEIGVLRLKSCRLARLSADQLQRRNAMFKPHALAKTGGDPDHHVERIRWDALDEGGALLINPERMGFPPLPAFAPSPERELSRRF